MRSDLASSTTKWPREPAMRNRVVIDLISSMTEAQAIHMYSRLTGYSFLSVTQKIIG